MVLNTETVHKKWGSFDFILLYKKDYPQDIDFRQISILTSSHKLFSSIILKRITTNIDNSQPKEQAGFRSGFYLSGTFDHIHTIEQIILGLYFYKL